MLAYSKRQPFLIFFDIEQGDYYKTLMNKNHISPELWARLEEVRNSMSIEGFDLSDAQLEEIAEDYLKDGGDDRFEELKKRAEREGRDYNKVVRESFCLKDFQK